MPSAETTARMFIGISLPVPLRETLANVAQHLKANYVKAGNWSRSDLYHVTLVFLGEIRESQRNIVELIAEEIATRHEPGSLTLTSVGAFPKGRILWSGIDVEEERKWGRLASQLADRIRDETGLSIERRPFRAHITLARKLATQIEVPQETDRLRSTGLLPSPTSPIREIALFSSKRVDGRLVYPVERVFSLNE